MENVNKRRRIFLSALSKLESGRQEINSREIRLKKKRAEFILKVTVCFRCRCR